MKERASFTCCFVCILTLLWGVVVYGESCYDIIGYKKVSVWPHLGLHALRLKCLMCLLEEGRDCSSKWSEIAYWSISPLISYRVSLLLLLAVITGVLCTLRVSRNKLEVSRQFDKYKCTLDSEAQGCTDTVFCRMCTRNQSPPPGQPNISLLPSPVAQLYNAEKIWRFGATITHSHICPRYWW